MKKTISITLILLISAGIYSQSQIPNGNFESWSDENNAIGWNSINYGFPLNIHSAVRTTDSYQGSYAASLTTESSILGIVPGLITLGEIDTENFTITGGIPFTDVPTGISCYFKYSPAAGDTMYFAALLTKWNDINNETDTIGFTAFFTNQVYENYTYVAVPFEYLSWGIPDTLNVVLISSGFSGHAGSSLTADEITLEYGTVISPTICFPAADITSSQFTANWLPLPDATSYNMDVSANPNFSSFLAGYENLSTGTDTFYIVDITPGIYFYRARVQYNTEVSINSNIIAVPAPTNSLDAINISETGFTANWESAQNATSYYIDVAEDIDFMNILAGYNNYDTGNNTELQVTGLEAETEYFYRVRVEYDTYLSGNSNIINLFTGSAAVYTYIDKLININTVRNYIFVDMINFKDIQSVSIFDIKGNLIKQRVNPSEKEIFTIDSQGIYIIEVKQKDNSFVKKISVIY